MLQILLRAASALVVSTIACCSWGQTTTLAERTQMTQRVDELLEAGRDDWKMAPPASETELLRRTYLDLTGRPPTGRQVIAYLETQSPNKHAELVQRLLSGPQSAEHLAAVWSRWLLPDEQTDNPFLQNAIGLPAWLEEKFSENLRYDRLVSDLLVASGSPERGPTGFFVVLGGEPKRIAAKTARVFMGVQLDCAECHDHPFDQWSQQDFWGYAAYFAQVSTSSAQPGMQNQGAVVDVAEGDVTLPESDEIVLPKPLVDTGLSVLDSGTRRQQLTLWLTARENPFLARATVNRVWALLFGRGLIEPIDDMRSIDIASHPELLEELSEYFSQSGYDLRNLIETLANTRAYRQSTRHPDGQPAPELYAVMATKPLTERQYALSIGSVARQVGPQSQAAQRALQQQLGNLRGDASEAKLGVVNALVTLHGQLVDAVSRGESSRLLKALEAPFLNNEKRVRWLFLSTLCREPTENEMTSILASIPETDSANADEESSDRNWQSDLLWALLNSSEFAMTP
ncbi:MAG TPA: hypothetical protein DDW52_26080 [Planctomycetaceae bacterium]|nr:hypothetical protein [Planctomycetaceae bacterium]